MYYDFSVNGAYDPLTALGGPGCTGFTQLGTIYARYICYGAQYSVMVWNGYAYSYTIAMWAFSSNNGMVTWNSIKDRITECANENCIWKTLKEAQYQSQFCLVKKYFSVKRMEKIQSPDDDLTNYSALTSASPTKQPHVYLIVAKNQADASDRIMRMRIRAKFYIKFYQKNPLTGDDILAVPPPLEGDTEMLAAMKLQPTTTATTTTTTATATTSLAGGLGGAAPHARPGGGAQPSVLTYPPPNPLT